MRDENVWAKRADFFFGKYSFKKIIMITPVIMLF